SLVETGIVYMPFGPAPNIAWDETSRGFRVSSSNLAKAYSTLLDWICVGHIETPSLEMTGSTLLQSLYKSKLIQPYANGNNIIGGVDLNPNLQPRNGIDANKLGIWV